MAHEIMENDGIFSVGETPWHGLGVILDSPPTVLEAITAAGLSWEVSPIPLYARIEIGDKSRGIDVEHKAILRTDTKEILGVVGPQFLIFTAVQAA